MSEIILFLLMYVAHVFFITQTFQSNTKPYDVMKELKGLNIITRCHGERRSLWPT